MDIQEIKARVEKVGERMYVTVEAPEGEIFGFELPDWYNPESDHGKFVVTRICEILKMDPEGELTEDV